MKENAKREGGCRAIYIHGQWRGRRGSCGGILCRQGLVRSHEIYYGKNGNHLAHRKSDFDLLPEEGVSDT